jgi:hypothetical protein
MLKILHVLVRGSGDSSPVLHSQGPHFEQKGEDRHDQHKDLEILSGGLFVACALDADTCRGNDKDGGDDSYKVTNHLYGRRKSAWSPRENYHARQ